jgi:hypothetical protein
LGVELTSIACETERAGEEEGDGEQRENVFRRHAAIVTCARAGAAGATRVRWC